VAELKHLSTITLRLSVTDGEFEEKYALSNDNPGDGFTALDHLLKLTRLRSNVAILGFSWALKPKDESDQFFSQEVKT
jgi:hypothetical protein